MVLAGVLGLMSNGFSSVLPLPLLEFDEEKLEYHLVSPVLKSSSLDDCTVQIRDFQKEDSNEGFLANVLDEYLWLFRELSNGWYGTEYAGIDEADKARTLSFLEEAIKELS